MGELRDERRGQRAEGQEEGEGGGRGQGGPTIACSRPTHPMIVPSSSFAMMRLLRTGDLVPYLSLMSSYCSLLILLFCSTLISASAL